MGRLILLATDIFGETGPVRELAARLEGRGHGVGIVGPYPEACAFGDEQEAYAFFLGQGGVAPYAERIRARLAEEAAGPLVGIGFSAGAAALWRALAGPGGACVETAILFYGSQIRNDAELQPRCDTLLVFPAEEPHFSVAGLVGRLRGRPQVRCATVPWSHGYLNRLSRNFNREGYQRTLAWLDELLDQPGGAEGGEEVFRPLLRRGS